MANMTWKDLEFLIKQMPDESKKENVTIFVDTFDEWFPISGMDVVEETDVLDEGGFYLTTPNK